jgi:HEAT repeat protein/negative regulator of replication initiation
MRDGVSFGLRLGRGEKCMIELKQALSLPVWILVIISTTAGMCFSRSYEASSGRPAETPSVQTPLRHLGEPDAWRETRLRDELSAALSQYVASRSPSLREECQSLLARILALPKPTAKAYSLCATTANALDDPRQAIEILKKAIEEYPEEHAWGPILPLEISGHFRIAAIASRIGDVNEAVRRYETIRGNLGDLESRRLNEFLCCLHLAELLRQIPGKEREATESLREAVSVAEGFGEGATRGDEILNAQLLKGWAAYEGARIRPDEASGGSGPDPNVLPSLSSCWMFAMVWASISCPSVPEMELMVQSNGPSTLRILAGFGLVTIYIEDSNLDPPKAEKHLLSIIAVDSYFKPYAEGTLALVYEKMREIREEIPVLLNDLRHGDVEQREQAAFRLNRLMGPEGIEALREAQQDPNEYVRYEAACALAKARDPNVRPNFRTILDALMDEDASIRKKARSAIGNLQSKGGIGPEDAVALVRLMDEHRSTELVWTLTDVLFSARLEVQEPAIAELAPLMNHQSEEVREGTVEIYGRIADSLLMRLEFEEESTQVKIIGVLGRLNPVADQLMPALTLYAQHENQDIRDAAIDALKNLSSTNESEALQDTRVPEEK